MDNDVPDSTDWLNTPLQAFADLENALHCQVCKEFYDTPMLTSCSHTFCSKCIRTCLSADGRCPACRASDQASKLRNNWALQEVVAAFQAARPAALSVARKQQEQAVRPGKRKRETVENGDVEDAEGRTTRSRSKRIAASQVSQASQTDVIEVDDSEAEDASFELESEDKQELEDGLVECPLGCGKRMKIEAVEPHLDRCEDERKQREGRSKSHTPQRNGIVLGGKSKGGAPHVPLERLAEPNYSLMNDTKLGRKLKDVGIPNWGNRQLMIRRYTEWANLWNANCDSRYPRTKRELLQDLDTWERTQGGNARKTNGVGSTVMQKDFDGAGWSNKNRDDFSRLIADARRTKGNSTAAPDKASPLQEANVAHNPTQAHNENTADLSNSASVSSGNVQSSSSGAQQEPSAAPYANNEAAIASIRHKVAAANAGQPVEPLINAVFNSDPSDNTRRPSSSASSTVVRPPQEIHSAHEGTSCDLPAHIAQATSASSPAGDLRVPMFAVPQRSVSDIDDGGTAGGGTEGAGASDGR